MAKSRLTPDYIEWVMSLNANQALREIHKVNEETKELERQQNAARQAIVKLEAEGKKYSKEWKDLSKSVKEYRDKINANNEKRGRCVFRIALKTMEFVLLLPNPYSWGPAATRALPASLSSYLTKFLMKRLARSLAFSSHCAASA